MAEIDHLVVRAESLAEGVEHVEAALGVKMAGGGEHKGHGTHNRLMSLGGDRYLEVIAPNPAEPAPKHARMFDMDRFSGTPSLSAWVLRVKNISQAMAIAPEGMGEILALSRGEFRWLFSFPPGGRLPYDGAFPALIEWQSEHPAPLLPATGCHLQALKIYHPQAEELRQALVPLIRDKRLLVFQGATFSIRARFATAHGTRLLGM